ncbi:hypothetical protein CBL_03181 [Carabus blaptoides fortunei]
MSSVDNVVSYCCQFIGHFLIAVKRLRTRVACLHGQGINTQRERENGRIAPADIEQLTGRPIGVAPSYNRHYIPRPRFATATSVATSSKARHQYSMPSDPRIDPDYFGFMEQQGQPKHRTRPLTS